MAAGDTIYVQLGGIPRNLVEYVDTGRAYNSAPIFRVVPSGSAIDDTVSDGLLGTRNSIGYRVAEIERHLHSFERWFGSDGATGGTENTLLPWTLDSGNNVWGSWVAILDADDTPAIAGSVYYDPHRIQVTNTERTSLYRIQIAFGAVAADALAAGDYTEFTYIAGSNVVDSGPIDIHSRRLAVGTPIWARCWNAGDTAEIDFLIGIHEYEG